MSEVRYHVGSNKPGEAPTWRVECIKDLVDALEWLSYDVESVLSWLDEQHRERHGTSLAEARDCECGLCWQENQALNLLDYCEGGQSIAAHRIGEEDYWVRPVVGCECPCNCYEPCGGEHHHEAAGPFAVPTA